MDIFKYESIAHLELNEETKKLLAVQLDKAYWELFNRGLNRGAQHAVETLCGLDTEYKQPPPPVTPPFLMKAHIYIHTNEFKRSWASIPKETNDPTAKFLRLYARYLAGEKHKQDSMSTGLSPEAKPASDEISVSMNPFIEEVYQEIEESSDADIDPHLMYLKGVLHRAKNQLSEAVSCLISSVTMYPYNWSVWLELKCCFTRLTDIDRVMDLLNEAFLSKPVESRVMLLLFLCHASEELDPSGTAELLSNVLIPFFPKLSSLTSQLARVYNCEGHYEMASELFLEVLTDDRFRLEDMDVYSNLLYVTEQPKKLSVLAQYAYETDKFRAESNCIMANYHSLKGEHERSIKFYKRALAIDPAYISAWTLMGHEYIEVGNPHAAIESYRFAVDLAGHDFRPWFGLGQAYELLGLHCYGLYYFQKALALRPTDVRLWDSLASCYEALARFNDALDAFKQAFRISDGDVYYGYRLGVLSEKLGSFAAAERYMTTCAEERTDDEERSEQSKEWQARAQIWLANKALDDNDPSTALHWVKRVSFGTREMLEEVRRIEMYARIKAEDQ